MSGDALNRRRARTRRELATSLAGGLDVVVAALAAAGIDGDLSD